MIERDSFMWAIVSDPADDTPRLVFADWLEEHGEPTRAEFVRVQCRIAALDDPLHNPTGEDEDGSDCPLCDELVVLRRRERKLLEDHGFEWCDRLLGPEWKTDGWEKNNGRVRVGYFRGTHHTSTMWFGFSRGMIDSWEGEAADWLAHADALAWHPAQTVEEHAGLGLRRRVPRPFPSTAQPITAVSLTDRSVIWPSSPTGRGFEYLRGDQVLERFEATWGWITFHLPPLR